MGATTGIKSYKSGTTDEFWLVFSAADRSNVAKDVVSALYYLPENFKLMILEDKDQTEGRMAFASDIKNRIKYKTIEGLQNLAALSDTAGVMIYDNLIHPMAQQIKPSVNISSSASKEIDSTDSVHYTVTANRPEALATAALHISRMSTQ